MDLKIQNALNIPIYDQIYSQIRDQIISGKLHEDELLPSIRTLAKDNRISVITTKRAYDELESDGYIYTVAGRGCFVKKVKQEKVMSEQLKEIRSYLKKVALLAKPCGISEGELAKLMHEALYEKKEGVEK